MNFLKFLKFNGESNSNNSKNYTNKTKHDPSRNLSDLSDLSYTNKKKSSHQTRSLSSKSFAYPIQSNPKFQQTLNSGIPNIDPAKNCKRNHSFNNRSSTCSKQKDQQFGLNIEAEYTPKNVDYFGFEYQRENIYTPQQYRQSISYKQQNPEFVDFNNHSYLARNNHYSKQIYEDLPMGNFNNRQQIEPPEFRDYDMPLSHDLNSTNPLYFKHSDEMRNRQVPNHQINHFGQSNKSSGFPNITKKEKSLFSLTKCKSSKKYKELSQLQKPNTVMPYTNPKNRFENYSLYDEYDNNDIEVPNPQQRFFQPIMRNNNVPRRFDNMIRAPIPPQYKNNDMHCMPLNYDISRRPIHSNEKYGLNSLEFNPNNILSPLERDFVLPSSSSADRSN